MVLEIIAIALLSLLFALVLTISVLRKNKGNEKMQSIASAIQEGAIAYLNRQYKTVGIFAVVIAVILYFTLGMITALSFILGAFFSALSGYIGMMVAVKANVRTAEAAKKGTKNALDVAFKGGAVNGFGIVGLGLLGVAGLYMLVGDPNLIIGFAFGASLVSLFARVGGGIFTKAADVGADLVGKIEKGIPEDDPRNPAVIADNVGDNVGDCAGMGADLFESYIVTLIAAMLLGSILYGPTSEYVIYPMIVAAVGIVASMIATFFVKVKQKGEKGIWSALNNGLIISAILSVVGFFFASSMLPNSTGIFLATLVGLVTTLLISNITEYFTSREKGPVKEIALASETGAGTNIITGIAVGLRSTILPVIVIAVAMILAYNFAGIYGIGIAAMGLLSITGMIMSIDSYGPITDNAGGIAEMSKMPKNVRKTTDQLDAVGNTTKATTKGVAIASAALSALALFAAFVQIANLSAINIFKVNVLAGLLIGAALPFLFSAFTMNAVAKSAKLVVEEVRRQFKDNGIMRGTKKPDYSKCVDIATQGAIKELMVPALLAVLFPIIVGLLLGPEALAGMIAGTVATGLLLALFLSNAGAAWDNAKKYIELGNLGGKGSEAHKAAVIGDTVGDPSKDTCAPAINPLIKVINTISLLLAPLIIAYGLHAF